MTFIIFLALIFVALAGVAFHVMIEMFADKEYLCGILLLLSGIWLTYYPATIIAYAIHTDKEAVIEIPLQNNDTITLKTTIKYEDISNR